MMKKKILLMCMALMSAMTLWAGHVFLEPDPWDPVMMHGNVGVDNLDPGPGDIVTVNVAPDPGYHLFIEDIVVIEVDENNDFIDSLTVTGPPETQVPENYTFQMPLNDHNVRVSVTFTGIEYPLNSFTGGGSGHCEVKLINGQPLDTIAFPDPHNIMARTGDTITLKVTPDLGWQLNYINLEYQGNVNLLPNTEFIMPSDPTTVVAYFNLVNLTITINNSDPNGTLSIYSINGQEGLTPPYIAHIGEDIALNFTPNPGYILDHVDIVANDTVFNRTLINGEMNFDMPPCDITLIPTFAPLPFSLYVDVDPSHGTVTAKDLNTLMSCQNYQSLDFPMGNTVQLSNVPAQGYMFNQYAVINEDDGTDVLVNASGQFTMPAGSVRVLDPFVPQVYNITTVATPVNNGNTGGDVNVVSPVDPNDYTTGNTIIIYFDVHPGYTFNSITVTRDDGGGTVPTIYVADGYYQFTMPPSDVTVTVNYNRSQYNINIIPNPDGNFGVTGVTPPYTAYVDDMVTLWDTPNPGYYFVKYILQGDADNPAYNVAITTNTFQMPPHDVNVSVEFAKNQHKVQVQNVYGGTAEAWIGGTLPVYDPVTQTYQPVDYGDAVNMIVTSTNRGYYLSHYELYDLGNYPGPQLTGLWLNPPDNTDFSMPNCDVLVVPVFLPINYVLALDMTNWWGGYITATNTSASPPTPPISAGDANTGIIPPLIFPTSTTNAHIGDVIQMGNNRDMNSNYLAITFSYYVLTRSDGYFIGEMTQNEFTMPPCDVKIGALFDDTAYGVPPMNPVSFWSYVTARGRVLLHQRPDLKKQSKSSPDEEDMENYGWARVVQGEPMYFVVEPNLGNYVNKNDIVVRLVDVSQGEGGQVVKEYRAGGEFDIFGPDESQTELTEYHFIFDVPEGVELYNVKVEIYADFTSFDYTITVDGAIEHGTVVAPTSAKADDVVALTVTPDPGYRLESITVTPEEPGFIVSMDQNNQFVMPACNVFVSATFTEVDFLRGDANGDTEVTIADVSALIDYLLTGDESLINMDAANCNGDDDITIADVSALIDYLLTGSW